MTLYLLYLVGLFFALTPGVLFTFPVKGTYKIALAHAFLFGLLYYLIDEVSSMAEGFITLGLNKCKTGGYCKLGQVCVNGMCGTKKHYSNSTGTPVGMKRCPEGGFCDTRLQCAKKYCLDAQVSHMIPNPSPGFTP
jgi:hypothetical protein